jgi:hypothetical protein
MESDYYLQPAIILMFLLIQIACLLFLVGLVIQSISDQQTLGHVLLAFCLSGALIFITMICLPFFTSLSSFWTPLSDLVSLTKPQAPYTPSNLRDINECLGEIFYYHLIKSPIPSRVDGAVAELTLPDFKEKRIQSLCRNEAPERMLEFFRLCASTSIDDSYLQNAALSNYFLAFLRLAHRFEADDLKLDPELEVEFNPEEDYFSLLRALATLLEPGHPLHRLDTMPEPLRPLQLALKTDIVCLFEQRPYLKPSSLLHTWDFHPTEVTTCPWEVVRGDIHSSDRLHVMLAACRGVLQAKNNVMNLSALILGLSIAKGRYIVLLH